MQIHTVFYCAFAALLLLALATWWFIDRSKLGMGLKAIREDEDKAQALGVPTDAYKTSAFALSAGFTAVGGGLYAAWFNALDPVFVFSIVSGANMVLMSLLGGVRHLLAHTGGDHHGARHRVLPRATGRDADPPGGHRPAAGHRRAGHAGRQMPSPSAALASTRPGYAMSSEPFEQMMHSLRPPASSSSSNDGIGAGVVVVMVWDLLAAQTQPTGLGNPAM
jgi:hypothetical protein